MDEQETREMEERNAAYRLRRAKNGNLFFSEYPAEARAMLNDPRLQGMPEVPEGIPNVRALSPPVITREPSKYLQIKRGWSSQPADYARWVNQPLDFSYGFIGRGVGFDSIEERPRIEVPRAPPKKLFHFWEFRHLFVASPDVLEVLRASCPDVIASTPIDWVFSNGQALEGYEFVDFISLHDAYDWRRSVVNVALRAGNMYPELGYDRALREDIPADAGLFRDSFHRSDVFVSYDLAAKLARFAKREVAFYDVQTHGYVEFANARPPRSIKARLKQEQWPDDDLQLPLERRMAIRVMPLVSTGRFAEAEALLIGWMEAMPSTPFHAICKLSITTSLDRCAEFFNEFFAKARRKHALKAVYCEMNGFAINPDRWFCDAFGFAVDGGDDGHDWLGDYDSSSEGSLVIDGLEQAQAVFSQRLRGKLSSPEDSAAERLAEALVITKFQSWLQRAVPLMNTGKLSFRAAAHDYYEFLGVVIPRGS